MTTGTSEAVVADVADALREGTPAAGRRAVRLLHRRSHGDARRWIELHHAAVERLEAAETRNG